MKTASQLVIAPAIEVWPETTLRAFAELLEENSIGAALVRGAEGASAGVISERDVVRALADGVDPDTDRVGDYMTCDIEFARADTPSDALAATMLSHGIRHLPGEDDDGKVHRVLSNRNRLAAVARIRQYV